MNNKTTNSGVATINVRKENINTGNRSFSLDMYKNYKSYKSFNFIIDGFIYKVKPQDIIDYIKIKSNNAKRIIWKINEDTGEQHRVLFFLIKNSYIMNKAYKTVNISNS